MLIDDRMDRQVSWMIYDALPHIQYEVQIRAKDEFDGLWSDWSDTVYAVTWTGNKVHSIFNTVIIVLIYLNIVLLLVSKKN